MKNERKKELFLVNVYYMKRKLKQNQIKNFTVLSSKKEKHAD